MRTIDWTGSTQDERRTNPTGVRSLYKELELIAAEPDDVDMKKKDTT